MRYLKKALPVMLLAGSFIIVLFVVPYPENLTQANLTQIIPFFASLYLTLTTIFNLIFKNILLSLSISLGLVFLLILNALDSLNILTGALTIVATFLLISYFWKGKGKSLIPIQSGLTNGSKIPKLTKLRRQK